MAFLAHLVSALFRADPFLKHEDRLPACGKHALIDVVQNSNPNVPRLCYDIDLLNRFLWSLSTYCMWNRRQDSLGSSQSDYQNTIDIIEAACPDLQIEEHELGKRQASGTTTTAKATTSTATSASTTPSTQSSTSSLASTSSAAAVQPTTSSSSASQTPSTTSINTSSSTLQTTTSRTTSSSVVQSTSSADSSKNSDATSSSGSSTSTNQASASTKSTTTSKTSITQVSKVSLLSIATSVSVDTTQNLFGIPVVAAQTTTQDGASSPPSSNPTAYLPTQSYSGQAILVGTCTVPSYTAVLLSDGSYLVLPVVGCNNNDPGCCPSLIHGSGAPTSSSNLGSVSNAAIITALAASPITTCPADYTSTSFVCCPLGFSLYGQAIFGQTPCASVLPQAISTPAAISQDIESLSSYVASTANVPTPTVSVKVIVDQVFALSLPLKQGVEGTQKSGMSAGSKIGIGVGAGLGGLLLILLCAWLIWLKRHKPQKIPAPDSNPANDQSHASWVGSYNHEPKDTSSPAAAIDTPWKPNTAPGGDRTSEISAGWRPGHQQNPSQFSANPVTHGWQPQPQQHQQHHPYVRQPPPRFTEGFMGMPTGQNTSPPLPTYSPPPEAYFTPANTYGHPINELPGRGREVFEAGAGVITPVPRRDW